MFQSVCSSSRKEQEDGNETDDEDDNSDIPHWRSAQHLHSDIGSDRFSPFQRAQFARSGGRFPSNYYKTRSKNPSRIGGRPTFLPTFLPTLKAGPKFNVASTLRQFSKYEKRFVQSAPLCVWGLT
jgi:hypothetical protein